MDFKDIFLKTGIYTLVRKNNRCYFSDVFHLDYMNISCNTGKNVSGLWLFVADRDINSC